VARNAGARATALTTDTGNPMIERAVEQGFPDHHRVRLTPSIGLFEDHFQHTRHSH
jgi:hypothetical protein